MLKYLVSLAIIAVLFTLFQCDVNHTLLASGITPSGDNSKMTVSGSILLAIVWVFQRLAD